MLLNQCIDCIELMSITIHHHQIYLSKTGNACLINETEGRPRVSCLSISTVLFLGFIPLAVFLQIIFTIFL